MKIESTFQKCILCKENAADSWEHIMPESIGGRLQVQVLCSVCNNTLGSQLISKVKEDPSIRLAVHNLKKKIPQLFDAIENHQIYFSKDKNGNLIRWKRKNSKFEIIANKREDGSLVIDTKRGIKNIVQMLKKDGLSQNEVTEKIQYFQRLDENKIAQLSKTVTVAKWSIGSPSPSLEGHLLDERFVALTAYEFLSLMIGNAIYDEGLDFIRNIITKGEPSGKLVIESFMTRDYEPIHTIYPELLETEIILNIILFGWLWYKVHLKGFRLVPPDFVYLEDLTNKRPLWAKSVDEAKQGIWYEFQT